MGNKSFSFLRRYASGLRRLGRRYLVPAVHIAVVAALLLSLVGGLSSGTTPGQAATPTPVARPKTGMTPPSGPYASVVPDYWEGNAGQSFTASISLGNMPSIYGAEFHLKFDPSKLQVVDNDPVKPGIQVQNGSFIVPSDPAATIQSVDNINGFVNWAATLLNPQPAVSGAGILANINFSTTSPGWSSLTFENPVPYQPGVKVADAAGNPVPTGGLMGLVRANPPAPRVEMPWTGAPPFSQVTVPVYFVGDQPPSSFDINVNFDNTKVRADRAIAPNVNINNPAGTVRLWGNPAGPPFAQQQVVFHRFAQDINNFDIFRMNDDGTGLTRLTFNNAADVTPHTSLAGQIVFASDRDGNFEIYTMDPFGGNQTRMTNHPARDSWPNFRPDGAKIVFVSDRDNPAGDIYVMDNVPLALPARLTNGNSGALAPFTNTEPHFSWDGSKIAFTSNRDGNNQIYILDLSTSVQTRLTNNNFDDHHPSFMLDGRILFTSNRSGNNELYVMDAAPGAAATNLTNNGADDDFGRIKPTGAKIAWASNRDGNYEIYKSDPTGTSPQRLTNYPDIDSHPDWIEPFTTQPTPTITPIIPTVTPTPSPTPFIQPTPTPSPTPNSTPTPGPTPTPTVFIQPTLTPLPSPTANPSPTATPVKNILTGISATWDTNPNPPGIIIHIKIVDPAYQGQIFGFEVMLNGIVVVPAQPGTTPLPLNQDIPIVVPSSVFPVGVDFSTLMLHALGANGQNLGLVQVSFGAAGGASLSKPVAKPQAGATPQASAKPQAGATPLAGAKPQAAAKPLAAPRVLSSNGLNISNTTGNSTSGNSFQDANDNIHLTFADNTPGNNDIYYAYLPFGGAWTAPVNISHNAAGSVDSRVRADAAGNVFAVWDDSLASSTNVSFAMKPAGGAWSAPLDISSVTGAIGWLPQIALYEGLSGTEALVTWEYANFTTGLNDIYYSHRSASGVWSAPVNVSNLGHSTGHFLVKDNKDNLHLVWSDNGAGVGEIYYATLPFGGSWSVPVNISNTPGQMSQNPKVRVDDLDRPHVMWEEYVAGYREIYYAFKPVGGVWSAPYNVSNDAADDEGTLQFRINSGKVYAVWQRHIGAQYDIFYSERVIGLPVVWSAPVNLSNTAGAWSTNAQIQVDDSGGAHVVYYDNVSGNNEIYYTYKPWGGAWTAPVNVSGNATDSTSPQIMVDANNLHILWTDSGGVGGNTDVFYATQPAPPAVWSGPLNISNSAGVTNFSPGYTSKDVNGNIHLVYSDNTTGNYDIYYAYLPNGGSWTGPVNISNNSGLSTDPRVRADSLGNVFAMWIDSTMTTQNPAGLPAVYVAMKPAGGSWGTPTNLTSANGLGTCLNPNLQIYEAADGTHTFFVWAAYPPAGGNADIWYAHGLPGGGAWQALVNVSNNASMSLDPNLIRDSNNNLHLVWTDGAAGSQDILYSYLPAGSNWVGSNWTAAVNLSNTPSKTSQVGRLSSDASNVYAYWEEDTGVASSFFDIFFAQKPSGGNWLAPVNVSNSPAVASDHASMAVASDGTLHLAWDEAVAATAPATGTQSEIFYANRTPGGSWSAPVNLSNNPGLSFHPQVATWSGDVFLSYHDNSPDPASTNYEVYYTRRPSGGAWTAPVNISNNNGNSRYSKIILDPSRIHLLWNDNTPGNFDILYAWDGWSQSPATGPSPTPTPTPQPTATPTVAPSPTATPSPSPMPSPSPTASPSPSPTPQFTQGPTPTPSVTPGPTPGYFWLGDITFTVTGWPGSGTPLTITINSLRDIQNNSIVASILPGMIRINDPPGQPMLVFHSMRDNNPEIYSMPEWGAPQTRLTNNSAVDIFPHAAPVAGTIVYASDLTGGKHIWFMNANGSGQTQLTFGAAPDDEPGISADGNVVVFSSVRDGNDEIYVLPPPSDHIYRLTNDPATDRDPHLNWAGDRVVFTSDRAAGHPEIWAMNAADGSGLAQLTFTLSPVINSHPSFTPDGRILFVSNRDPGNPSGTINNNIYIMNGNGTNVIRLTNNNFDNDHPKMKPNGQRIAFASTRDGNTDIYTMNPDGTGEMRLTTVTAVDAHPDWFFQTGIPGPQPTPTPMPTYTPAPTFTPPPTLTPSPSPSPTPFVQPTPTPSPTPFVQPTPTPSPTPFVNPTPSPSPSPSPAPTGSPTPAVTPSPTPALNTEVQAGTATVNPGGSVQVHITVKNITATKGLGAYDLSVTYDKNVINVTDVVGGAGAFTGAPLAVNIDNTAGMVIFNGTQTSQNPGPTGNIVVANLVVTGVGAPSASTVLTPVLKAASLVDRDGAPIPAAPTNGSVTITATQMIPALGQSIGADGTVYLDVKVSRIRNPSTDADVQANGGIGGYDFTLTYPPGTTGNAVNMMAVAGVAPFNAPVYGNLPSTSGSLSINGFQTTSHPQAPTTLARVAPRIIGSSDVAHTITLTFTSLVDVASGANIPADGAKTYTVRRGDARADGFITISDALFVAQYLAGLRGLGEDPPGGPYNNVNAINGASARLEPTATGEQLTITDALFIAQLLAHLRDSSFNQL